MHYILELEKLKELLGYIKLGFKKKKNEKRTDLWGSQNIEWSESVNCSKVS